MHLSLSIVLFMSKRMTVYLCAYVCPLLRCSVYPLALRLFFCLRAHTWLTLHPQGDTDEVDEVFEETDEDTSPASPVAASASSPATAGADIEGMEAQAAAIRQSATQATRHMVNSSWAGLLAALSELLRASTSVTTSEALLR